MSADEVNSSSRISGHQQSNKELQEPKRNRFVDFGLTELTTKEGDRQQLCLFPKYKPKEKIISGGDRIEKQKNKGSGNFCIVCLSGSRFCTVCHRYSICMVALFGI